MMNDKKDLIEHIAERLRNHEEPYDLGAWEKFEAEQNKRKSVFPLAWIAAACVVAILGAGIFYFIHSNKSTITQQIAANNSITKNDTNTNISSNKNLNDSNIITTNSNQNPSSNIAQQNNVGNNHFNSPLSIFYTHPENISNNISLNKNAMTIVNTVIRPDTFKTANNIFSPANPTQNNQQTIDNNNTQTQSGKKQEAKLNYFPNDDFPTDDDKNTASNLRHRWSMDAFVAPSASANSNKVNMGYGVAVGYNLNQKISVQSGASYTQLTGYNSGSGIQSVQANVTGINVPIDLRYHITQKIYVSAGASALAVLNNKQQLNLVAANVASNAFYSNTGVALSTQNVLAAPKTQLQASPVSSIDNQKVVGFYNISLGMQQPLGKRGTKFSIEPFIAIPMSNNFSSQHIHLMNGGVKLKVGL